MTWRAPSCPHHLGLLTAAHPRDLPAEVTGNLNREPSDASRSSEDEHAVSGLHGGHVSHELQRGDRPVRDRSRFVVVDARGDLCDRGVLSHDQVLGLSPVVTAAEDFVSHLELRDRLSNLHHPAGERGAGDRIAGSVPS